MLNTNISIKKDTNGYDTFGYYITDGYDTVGYYITDAKSSDNITKASDIKWEPIPAESGSVLDINAVWVKDYYENGIHRFHVNVQKICIKLMYTGCYYAEAYGAMSNDAIKLFGRNQDIPSVTLAVNDLVTKGWIVSSSVSYFADKVAFQNEVFNRLCTAMKTIMGEEVTRERNYQKALEKLNHYQNVVKEYTTQLSTKQLPTIEEQISDEDSWWNQLKIAIKQQFK